MAKSRDKYQQLGFWDTEVSSPDHDAVCMWAYENADALFKAAHPEQFDRPWNADEITVERQKKEWAEAADQFAKDNSRPNPRIFRKELEFVLRKFSGGHYTPYGQSQPYERIIGYADLVIFAELPRITGLYARNMLDHFTFTEELTGLEISWDSLSRDPSSYILVEAKSKLPTIGELMRQIQLYRTAFRGQIVVTSPDESYSKILSEQNVTFVKCPL